MANTMLNGFARDATTTALAFVDSSVAVTPVIIGGFLRDVSQTPAPLVSTTTGPGTFMNGFVRDANYRIIVIDEGSATGMHMQDGFLRDVNGYIVTTSNAAVMRGGFERDAAGGLLATGVGAILPQMNLTAKASDFFNGSNAPLASPWKPISTGGMNVLSHEAIGTASTQLGNYRDSAIETYNSNQYSQATMGSAALIAGNYVALSVRNQDNANAYLLLYFMPSASTWQLQLYKKVAGTYTQLGGTNSGTLTAALPLGVQITLIAEGNILSSRLTAGGSPTQVLGQICMIDNTFTGGTPGIESFGASSVDNWQGGNAATGALPTQIVLDSFFRANGLVSAGQPNWTDLTATFSGVACNGASIVSDQVSASAAQHYADFRNETYHADQYASIGKGTNVAPSGQPFNMGLVRWNGTSGYIGGLFDASFPGFQIYSITAGTTSTVIGSAITTAASYANGTFYHMVCSGTRLSVRMNNCEVLTINDASFTTGQPGFMVFGITDAYQFLAGNTD